MTEADGDADDQTIIARVLAGDRDSFAVLVRRHQRIVYSLGLSFFRNADDAADFVQDVFVKAYRALGSFRGRSKFSTWLYRVAYNTALNAARRRREYLSLAEDLETPNDDAPERQALRGAARTAVARAVAELPERFRVCLDLYFFYGLSYPEIETVTGFPVNTIKSHVFRAKKLLRDELRDFADGGIE
jgi:RNA polymerase sigma-70 factor (ECF subfamily)